MDKSWLAGLASLAYLLLLGRSAWKQGEMRQFLVSLLILAVLGGLAAGIIAFYVYVDAF